MRPVYITKQLTTLDRDGIAVAQQLVGAGDLALAGDLTSGGVFTSTAAIGQRVIGIFSAGNLSGITFTVYGTDQNRVAISEAIAGPTAGNTVSTTLNFYTVTRVAASAAVGTNVEVGTTGVGATLPIPLDYFIGPTNVGLYIEIASGATVNATVQYTPDDVYSLTKVQTAGQINWTNHATLASKTASADGTMSENAAAVRLLVNSGTDAVTFIVRQAGLI